MQFNRLRQTTGLALTPALVALGLTAAVALGMTSSARAETHVRIVRISLVTGAVEVNLADGQGWEPALLDAPLVQGEQVRTLASGRAEIEFENGSTLRLIPNSTVTLTTLAATDAGEFLTSPTLNAGTAFVTLQKADAKDFHLLLGPNAEVAADGASAFRAGTSADSTGQTATAIEVFEGKADVHSGSQQLLLQHGEKTLLAPAVQLAANVNSGTPDTWTQWSRGRDEQFDAALRGGVQAGSLDNYVNWYDVAPGSVAMPSFVGTALAPGGAGNSACPWAVTAGDFAGWCWTGASGWFQPSMGIAQSSMLGLGGGYGMPLYGAGMPMAGLYGAGFMGMGPCDPMMDPMFGLFGFGSMGGFYGMGLGGCPGMMGGMYDLPWFDGGYFVGGNEGGGATNGTPNPLGNTLHNGWGRRFHPVGTTVPAAGARAGLRTGVAGGRQLRTGLAGRAAGRLGPPPTMGAARAVSLASGLRASRTSFAAPSERIAGRMAEFGSGPRFVAASPSLSFSGNRSVAGAVSVARSPGFASGGARSFSSAGSGMRSAGGGMSSGGMSSGGMSGGGAHAASAGGAVSHGGSAAGHGH